MIDEYLNPRNLAQINILHSCKHLNIVLFAPQGISPFLKLQLHGPHLV